MFVVVPRGENSWNLALTSVLVTANKGPRLDPGCSTIIYIIAPPYIIESCPQRIVSRTHTNFGRYDGLPSHEP